MMDGAFDIGPGRLIAACPQSLVAARIKKPVRYRQLRQIGRQTIIFERSGKGRELNRQQLGPIAYEDRIVGSDLAYVPR
jgi:hypothetical protein